MHSVSAILLALLSVSLGGAAGLDDTAAIQAVLNNCSATNGVAQLPPGTHIVSVPPRAHQLAVDAALAIPSNCVVQGAGRGATVVKFDAAVHTQNWWRMFSTAAGSVSNITIQDVTLDGSTNWTSYDQCKGVHGFCEHGSP